MRLKLEKNDFIKSMENEMEKGYIALEFFYNEIKLVTNNYMGKVINKRFDSAINACIDVHENRMFLRPENSYETGKRNYSLQVYLYGNGYESIDLYFSIDIDPETQRIIGVTQDNNYIDNFRRGIEERKQCIENFDSYTQQLQHIEDLIGELKNVPIYMRENVDNLNSIYLPKR